MYNPQKRICCLICVYNDQSGLEQSLLSVFDDDPLADILVVDDGSTVACTLPSIPDGFHVTLVRHQKNEGLAVALNAGLDLILERGYMYVARLDAGDTVNRGRLKAQMEYLDANPTVGLLGTRVCAFDRSTSKPLFEFRIPNDAPSVMRTLKVRNCVPHPSAMIRAEAFRKVGVYNPSYKYAEDYEMWRRITLTYSAANFPTVYVNKAITPTQLTAVYRACMPRYLLKAQLKYFNWLDCWCWLGVARTCIAYFVPRWVLLSWHTTRARISNSVGVIPSNH